MAPKAVKPPSQQSPKTSLSVASVHFGVVSRGGQELNEQVSQRIHNPVLPQDPSCTFPQSPFADPGDPFSVSQQRRNDGRVIKDRRHFCRQWIRRAPITGLRKILRQSQKCQRRVSVTEQRPEV